MATPIIWKNGSVSGPSVAGQGSNDLVIAETVTLSDAEVANVGAAYFWEWEDIPIGSSAVLVGPTTASPTFVPDVTGSYRAKCTVDGVEFSVEIFAVPLPNTGARIPSFQEQEEYDESGNAKGWHEAQTVFMREADTILGQINASLTERNASAAVPQGTNTRTVELGVVTYPGSLLALSVRLEEALTAGTILVTVTVNGADKIAATINLTNPQTAHSIHVPGTYVINQSDIVRVRIDATGYVNAGGITSGLAINVVTSNDITTTALTLVDASNTTKGIAKLSLAPTVPTEPVAAGTNDARIPTQDENNALVGTSGSPGSSNKYVTNDDSRNSDARTPVTHKASHQNGNPDEISVAGLSGVLADPQTPAAHVHTHASTTGQGVNDHHDQLHAGEHLAAGGDSVTLTDSEIAAANKDGVAGTACMRTLGSGAQVSCAGNDARLSDARTPVTHDLHGTVHAQATIAQLSARVSDAVLAALDKVQEFTKNQRSHIVNLTDAATVTYDAEDSNIYKLIATVGIGATRELDNPGNLAAGMTWQVWFYQDVTAGGRALTYDTWYDWGDEGVPDFTGQGTDVKNIISCVALSTTQIACTMIKGFA